MGWYTWLDSGYVSVGDRYGNLLVIAREEENTKKGVARWRCVCDCQKFCVVQTHLLMEGTKTSCGCGGKKVIPRIEHSDIFFRGGGRFTEVYIGYKLPTLNTAIATAKKHPVAYSVFKRDWSNLCAAHFVRSRKAKSAITVDLVYIEPLDSRRDEDNVTHSQKYILDGLVTAGVIVDDKRKYIRKISTEFTDSGKAYGVVVTLREV